MWSLVHLKTCWYYSVICIDVSDVYVHVGVDLYVQFLPFTPTSDIGPSTWPLWPMSCFIHFWGYFSPHLLRAVARARWQPTTINMFELTKFLFCQKVTVFRSKHVQTNFWGRNIITHANTLSHECAGLFQNKKKSSKNPWRPALRQTRELTLRIVT